MVHDRSSDLARGSADDLRWRGDDGAGALGGRDGDGRSRGSGDPHGPDGPDGPERPDGPDGPNGPGGPERIDVSVVACLEVRVPGRDRVPGPIHNAAVIAASNPELLVGNLADVVGSNWVDPATGRGQDRSRRMRTLRSSGLFHNDRIASWVHSDAAELADVCFGLLAQRPASVAALRSFVARSMGRASVGRWADSRSVRGAEGSSAVLGGAPLITARRTELADLVGAIGLVMRDRGDLDAARDLEAIGRALLWPLHRRHSEVATAHELPGSTLQSNVDDLTVLLGHAGGHGTGPTGGRETGPAIGHAIGHAAGGSRQRRGRGVGEAERLLPTRSRAERHAAALVADLEELGAGLTASMLPLELDDGTPRRSITRQVAARRLGAALANLRDRSDEGTVRGEDVAELDGALRCAPALIDLAPTLLRFCPASSRRWEHALLNRLDGPSPYPDTGRSSPHF